MAIEPYVPPNPVVAAEAAAPPLETDVLPFTLPTLRYVPAAHQGKYARRLDGSFQLAWIHESDKATYVAHAAEIAKQGVRVLPDGESPVTQAEKDATRAAMQKTFEEEVKRLEAKQLAARDKAVSDRLAQQQLEAERERARIRASYGKQG